MGSNVAVILCAGRGTRMGDLTKDRPKCALEVNGESILERAMQQLRMAGVQRFEVVVGHCWEAIPRHFWGPRDRMIANFRYETTNTLASLACVDPAEWLDGFWLMNGDVVVSDMDVLRLGAAGSAVLMRHGETTGEEVKIATYGNPHVVDISKNVESCYADGEFIGLARFEAPFARCLLTAVMALKSRDPDFGRQYFEEAVQHAALVERLGFVVMNGNGIEIDTPDDYRKARELFG